MSFEAIEPPKSKVLIITCVLVGLLNALLWIIFGSRIRMVAVWEVSIWWVLFCLTLNIGVAFAILQQRTRQFRRLYWIIGVALFIAVACAFLLGLLTSLESTDSGGLAFLVRAAQGGFVGLVVGIIVGIKTTPSKFSTINIIQRIGEGIVTSTIIGIVITAISVFIMATANGLQSFINRPNYSDLIEYVFLNVVLITPAGAIPSVMTGVTTTLVIFAANRWLQRQNLASAENVG